MWESGSQSSWLHRPCPLQAIEHKELNSVFCSFNATRVNVALQLTGFSWNKSGCDHIAGPWPLDYIMLLWSIAQKLMCLSYQSILKISYIPSLITSNAHDTAFWSAGPVLSKFCTGISWIRQSEKSNPTNFFCSPQVINLHRTNYHRQLSRVALMDWGDNKATLA